MSRVIQQVRLAFHRFPDLAVRDHADDLDLVGNLLEHASDLPIALDEAKLGVLEATLLGELLDDQARLAEVVPREPREQVVRYLQVQPAMDELDPRRANHVHRRPELARKERLHGAEVGRRAREVREHDLSKGREGKEDNGPTCMPQQLNVPFSCGAWNRYTDNRHT